MVGGGVKGSCDGRWALTPHEDDHVPSDEVLHSVKCTATSTLQQASLITLYDDLDRQSTQSTAIWHATKLKNRMCFL